MLIFILKALGIIGATIVAYALATTKKHISILLESVKFARKW